MAVFDSMNMSLRKPDNAGPMPCPTNSKPMSNMAEPVPRIREPDRICIEARSGGA